MPSPEILEVAIGLTLVYFLLSLITSAIVEALAGLLKWRSYQLEKCLRDL